VRDEGSTSYVGAIEPAEEFGLRIYTEAWYRGWNRAVLKVLMGDGAVWIWNIGDQHFPGAVQIVDSTTPASIYGISLPDSTPTMRLAKSAGSWRHRTNSTTAASKTCSPPCVPSVPLRRK
jgi:hypothetical protein